MHTGTWNKQRPHQIKSILDNDFASTIVSLCVRDDKWKRPKQHRMWNSSKNSRTQRERRREKKIEHSRTEWNSIVSTRNNTVDSEYFRALFVVPCRVFGMFIYTHSAFDSKMSHCSSLYKYIRNAKCLYFEYVRFVVGSSIESFLHYPIHCSYPTSPFYLLLLFNS